MLQSLLAIYDLRLKLGAEAFVRHGGNCVQFLLDHAHQRWFYDVCSVRLFGQHRAMVSLETGGFVLAGSG